MCSSETFSYLWFNFCMQIPPTKCRFEIIFFNVVDIESDEIHCRSNVLFELNIKYHLTLQKQINYLNESPIGGCLKRPKMILRSTLRCRRENEKTTHVNQMIFNGNQKMSDSLFGWAASINDWIDVLV